ncbi:hypothetical protein VMCG_04135 [Cytospora schulzeri]|uniref:Phosphatidic acid phosphatase type 2/haloperoxidase domain-containing protein n=1 Tax=Cytospora schulzeri TaxID=448051 RepID=A0A423WU92_9PEZI|nr:hypothetical protein VMCG_04135 [Valsa malicola]
MNQTYRGSGSGLEPHDAPRRAKSSSPAGSNNPANGQDTKKEVIDAGLRSLDHYKRALPTWRYDLRQAMLPLVRWETPYLAWFQDAIRTPALDRYFAITANLGTHTFFMIGLPILFWCGFPAFGQGLVHILAEGVFFTGFIKDMVSLPRPLSPPLHRITMSGSAALEYGFPSTHSANAVSVAVYAVLCLRSADNTLAPTTKLGLELLGYFYAASIVIGRLYCGMHGFLDVIVGSTMGAAISLVEFYYGPPFNAYLKASGWIAPFILGLIIIILVRVHPEPADDCPCFDDSVAFAGVMIGLEAGLWHIDTDTLMGPFPGLSWFMATVRIVFGVLTIVAWREVMKPTLLKSLPALFRVIERLGVSLPRRFFVPASEYKNIPNLLKLRTDNVLPTMSDLPQFVKTLRAPARGRSVSVGPQSAADAYEALAYRERRRRESMGSNGSVRSHTDLRERFQADGGAAVVGGGVDGGGDDRDAHTVGVSTALADYEQQMGQGGARVVITRASPDIPPSSRRRSPSPCLSVGPHGIREEDEGEDEDGEGEMMFVQQRREDELGEREMFSRLIKPRVRYDVEVVTKLVVYTGIAWLAVEGIPLLHELFGIGIRHLHVK